LSVVLYTEMELTVLNMVSLTELRLALVPN